MGLGPETRPEDVNHSILSIIWWNRSPLMVSMLQQLPEIWLQPGDIQFRLAPTPLLGTLCNLEVEWTICPTVAIIDLWTYGSEQPCSSHVFTHTSPQKSPRIGIPGIQKPCYSPSSPIISIPSRWNPPIAWMRVGAPTDHQATQGEWDGGHGNPAGDHLKRRRRWPCWIARNRDQPHGFCGKNMG